MNTWVVNTTDAEFNQTVIERSARELVILDFWAPWCGPCRTLGPILEKLANEFAGQFILVKANTEEAPQAAGQYGVASIPTVLAISNGQPIDAFEGALPESSIRQWLNRILSTQQLTRAIRLSESDPAGAEQQLRQLGQEQPRNREIQIALATLLWQVHRHEECQQILEALERDAPLEPDAEKIRASLSLAAKADIDLDRAQAAASADGQNWNAQYLLAEALVGHQRYAEAFEVCLLLVTHDRKQTGEKARALMVEVFRSLPEDSPLTSEYRRKLASALY